MNFDINESMFDMNFLTEQTSAHRSVPSTTPRRPKHLSIRAVIAAVFAMFFFLVSSQPAFAHDELVGYAAVASAEGASGIELTFSNSVMDIGTEVIVSGTDGTNIADGDPQTNERTVTQYLLNETADGSYNFVWRVVSSDGHPIQGELFFNLVAGEITDLSTEALAQQPEEDAPADSESTTDAAAEPGLTDVETTNADTTSSNEMVPATQLVLTVVASLLLIATVFGVIIGTRRRRSAIESAIDERNNTIRTSSETNSGSASGNSSTANGTNTDTGMGTDNDTDTETSDSGTK